MKVTVDNISIDAVSYTHLDVYKRQKLFCGIYATEAHDTTSHVQGNIWPNIFLLKSAAFKFITRALVTMLIAEVLQIAFSRLVANRAIKGMVKQ